MTTENAVNAVDASGLTVGATVYPAGDWLNSRTQLKQYETNYYNSPDYWWIRPTPCVWPTITTLYQSNTVRLKLSEVETLREVVRNNEAARKVLNKLAHLIEIEVDF